MKRKKNKIEYETLTDKSEREMMREIESWRKLTCDHTENIQLYYAGETKSRLTCDSYQHLSSVTADSPSFTLHI